MPSTEILIAVVAHTKWLHKLVDIEDKIFRNINMKGFSTDGKDQAVEFLKSAKTKAPYLLQS